MCVCTRDVRLLELQSKSLLCVNNLLSVMDVSQLPEVSDTLTQLWTHLTQLTANTSTTKGELHIVCVEYLKVY